MFAVLIMFLTIRNEPALNDFFEMEVIQQSSFAVSRNVSQCDVTALAILPVHVRTVAIFDRNTILDLL